MPSYLTVEKIGFERGVYFTMEVHKMPKGFYKCYAYAMASGCKLTDWQYIALSKDEAYEDLTKEYLLRELKPLAFEKLKQISQIYRGD
jgi:hypothetical protein